MAWKWPAAAKNGTSEEWTGFIDQGVTLEGTLTVTGTFRIDGNVKGNIISEQTVVLGEILVLNVSHDESSYGSVIFVRHFELLMHLSGCWQ